MTRQQGSAQTGGYSGTRHPGFAGTNLIPRPDSSVPRAPPAALIPAASGRAGAQCAQGAGRSSAAHPLGPRFTASCTSGALGVRSIAAVAVGGDAWFLCTVGQCEAGEPEVVINSISYYLIVPFCSARCRTQHSALVCPH